MPLPLAMDYAELGGEKEDFEAVTDAETQISAEELNATRCAVAMLSRMCPRALVTFQYVDGYAEVLEHEAVWGNAAEDAPEVARNDTGDFTITWPATVEDERGDSHSVNIVRGFGNIESDAGYRVNVARVDATSVDVFVSDAAGDPIDTSTITTVYVR